LCLTGAAETIHAHNRFNTLIGVKSTADNLKAVIEGESYEVINLYPGMIADAEAEGEKKALSSYKWIFEVEKIHEALYRKVLEHMDPDTLVVDYYICPICGYTHEGKFEGKCPLCNTPANKFVKVE
jgi:rubrerythrin